MRVGVVGVGGGGVEVRAGGTEEEDEDEEEEGEGNNTLPVVKSFVFILPLYHQNVSFER